MLFVKRLYFKISLVCILALQITYLIINFQKNETQVNNANLKINIKEYKIPVKTKKHLIKLKSRCACRMENVTIYRLDDDMFEIDVTGKKKYTITKTELKSITCDLYNVLRRGFGQNVIGYSLYGRNIAFYNLINGLIQIAFEYFPSWIIRIYYDSTVNQAIICQHECNKHADTVDFCFTDNIPNHYGTLPKELGITPWRANYTHSMIWRWFPINEPFVDAYMSRDLDSLIIQREVDSVKVWLNSKTLFHIMRDHPHHSIEMLGGMWSYLPKMNRPLSQLLFKLMTDKDTGDYYKNGNNLRTGGDQEFLRRIVWPYARTNSTIHDSYNCKKFGGVGFPTKRTNRNCFIGCYGKCCENNKTLIGLVPCPLECRPDGHKDWEYC